MNVTFQKRSGNRSLGILFTWRMTLEKMSPEPATDPFIPELFLDYFYIQKGKVECIDERQGIRFFLPRQSLKTLYTHPLIFRYTTPLVLYGARLSLPFAESFWGEMRANRFLNQTWVEKEACSLDELKTRVAEYVQQHRIKRLPYPMLSSALEESSWLIHYSPRHKRRLYQDTFGLSRKELQNVGNVQAFLEQACDFGSQNPRIIQYVDPDVFHDQPHLNHMFRKMTGLSPVEYFEKGSILQDTLMSASYNEDPGL